MTHKPFWTRIQADKHGFFGFNPPFPRISVSLLFLFSILLVAACTPPIPAPQMAELTPTPSPLPAGTPPALPDPSAANADVEFVRATLGASGSWTFDVTVRHPDTGWEDYADGWDVVLPDGTVLKPDSTSPFTRLLTHPHEDEQPFTRSQGGIAIPDGVEQVTVRAHDLVEGWGGAEIVVELAQRAGPGFEVER